MEHIKTIEINNFKSIRHLKMEGCRRINVLIGPPNVGKSNILEAMGLYHFGNDTPHAHLQDLIRLKNFSDIFYNWNIEDQAKILLNDVFSLNLEYVSNTQLNLQFASSLGLDGKKTEESELISLIECFPTEEIQRKLKSFDLLFQFPLIKLYKFFEEKLDNKKNPPPLDIPFGSNLFEVIRLDKSLRKKVSELVKIYNLKIVFEQPGYDLRFWKFLEEDTSISIPFYLFADTLKRLIFFQAAIEANKNAVILFEEPEAHSFPPYISKLVSDIIFDQNENQYFIVTHSPYVLNDFMEHAMDDLAIFIINQENGSTISAHHLNSDEIHEAYQYGYDFFMNMENFGQAKVTHAE